MKYAALVIHTGDKSPPAIYTMSAESAELAARTKTLLEQQVSFAVVFGNSRKEVLAWIHA